MRAYFGRQAPLSSRCGVIDTPVLPVRSSYLDIYEA
jgi:hypothetical protein